MSAEHRKYIKKLKFERNAILFFRILIIVSFVLLWELTSKLEIIDSFVFSSPTKIIKCFIDLWQQNIIQHHIWVTLYETLMCFFIVIAASIIIATIMWLVPSIFKVLEPYIVLLNSLPKSALAPVLIVWLGNNMKTIIIAAISVAVFGAILSIYTEFSHTDSEKIKLIKTLGGNRIQLLTKLVFPSALPTIVSTMKVNLGLSLVGVIIGEFLAAKEGLGYLIIYGSQVFKMTWILMSIIILCVISAILYGIISFIEKKMQP